MHSQASLDDIDFLAEFGLTSIRVLAQEIFLHEAELSVVAGLHPRHVRNAARRILNLPPTKF